MKEAQILMKILRFLFITRYSNAKYLLVEIEDSIVGQGEALGGKDLQELPSQEGIYVYSFCLYQMNIGIFLELVKLTTLNVFILYIGRTYTFKECMHRCCPNVQFCELAKCFKLCRGSKSKTAILPDGKFKHFIVLRIFQNLIVPGSLCIHCKKFVLEYQREDKGCYRYDYGKYSSLQKAKLACDSDKNCWGVYDKSCNDRELSLCPYGANTHPDAESCTYFKQGLIF